jgi:hypothetical protein
MCILNLISGADKAGIKHSIVHDNDIRETLKGFAHDHNQRHRGGKTIVLADTSCLVFMGGGGGSDSDTVAWALEKTCGGIDHLAVAMSLATAVTLDWLT